MSAGLGACVEHRKLVPPLCQRLPEIYDGAFRAAESFGARRAAVVTKAVRMPEEDPKPAIAKRIDSGAIDRHERAVTFARGRVIGIETERVGDRDEGAVRIARGQACG